MGRKVNTNSALFVFGVRTLSFIINPLEKGRGKNNTLLSRFVSNQVLEINQHKVEDVIMEHTGDICVLEWFITDTQL